MADVAETIEESGERIGHHAWVEMRLFEIVGGWSGTVPEPRARGLLATQSYHHAWHAELWHGLLPALPHLPTADLVAPDTSGDEIVAALAALDDLDGHGGGDAAVGAVGRGDGSGSGSGSGDDDDGGGGGDADGGDAGGARVGGGGDAGRDSGDDGGGAGHDGGDTETSGVAATLTRLEALYDVALPALAATYRDHLERTTAVTDGPARRVLHLVLADIESDRAAGTDLIDRLRSTAG